MEIKKYNPIINNKNEVKSYQYGNTLELTTARGPKNQTIKRIGKDRYVVLETGEIKFNKKKSTVRSDNLEVVKKTMKKLRRLIAHNFDGGPNQLWLTLTFSEQVTDYHTASKHYKQFIKKLRRRYSNLEYITVIEPQKSGRWHFHVLLKDSTGQQLYISNKTIEKAWNKGFTKTKRLKTTDKIGNYVTTYLTNLKIDNSDQSVKGARLYLYPSGIRIYRRSKNIRNPIELNDSKENILSAYNIQDQKPNFAKKTTYNTKYGEQKYFTEFYDDIKKEATPTKASDFSQKNNMDIIFTHYLIEENN